MDFFTQQQQARVNTRKLVVYLTLAIISLLAITHSIFYFVFAFSQSSTRHGRRVTHIVADPVSYVNSRLFWFITLAIIGIVIFSTLYKWLTLRAGGSVIAEHLGGRLISNTTGNFQEQRLLNVVQEMALASGTPIPPVYILEENAINAFAAGYSPADAVIGITRGAITHLNRDQLQGVIAHEFSHIFNGDARLNLNLIAILHGILVIGLLGYYAMRGARHADGRAAAGLFGIGLGLVILGYGGIFFGNLIKAAISRQREFLADASAVQFTRNPDGIAGALKVIGGTSGSLVDNARVDEVTHLLFAEGKHFVANWWATHPPLEQRIKRIEPRWDGKFITQVAPSQVDESTGGIPVEPPPQGESMVKAAAVLASIAHIGTIDTEHLGYTQQLMQTMPLPLIDNSRTPEGAAQILLALVLSQTSLSTTLHPTAQQAIKNKRAEHSTILPVLDTLPERLRLPLIDICVGSIKQGSADAADTFLQQLDEYIALDKKTSLFEWCLKRIINHQVATFFHRSNSTHTLSRISNCTDDLSIVLSMFAQLDSGQGQQSLIREVADKYQLSGVNYLPPDKITANSFQNAVDRLQSLRPLDKPIAIKACAQVISHDAIVAVKEVELLRALSASWDCPMPPLLVS